VRRLRVLLAPLAVTLAGCGVTASDDTSTAGADEVPYELLVPADPEPTTTTTTSPVSATVRVWFVANDRILPLERTLRSPVALDDVLGALLEGPTSGESLLGVRTVIVDEEPIASSVEDGVATIELPEGLAEMTPKEQLLGLAQLVHVATELASVHAVRFSVDGEVVGVPRADGSTSDAPARRADYAALTV